MDSLRSFRFAAAGAPAEPLLVRSDEPRSYPRAEEGVYENLEIRPCRRAIGQRDLAIEEPGVEVDEMTSLPDSSPISRSCRSAAAVWRRLITSARQDPFTVPCWNERWGT